MRATKVLNMGPGFFCQVCGREFQYAPVLMPATRPFPITGRPGFMDFKSVKMCIACVEKELPTLKEKIHNGEMFPLQVWDETMSLADAKYMTDKDGAVVIARSLFPEGHMKGE